MNTKTSLMITLLMIASSIAAFAQTETARPQFSLYGIRTLDANQSLRLTVQSARVSDREIIPCIRVRVVFDVYEMSAPENGRLRHLRSLVREVLLDGGEAAAVDFPAARLDRFVSASVFAACADDALCDGSVRLVSTLAVRESGRTALTLPLVEKGFDPQPDPPAGQ